MLRANIFQYDTFSDGSCVRKLFADDVKMYATIDVNELTEYISQKCAVMHIHSGNTRPVIGPSFDIGGSVLPIVDHVKDLGVLVDDC